MSLTARSDGTARFKDSKSLVTWYSSLSLEEAEKLYHEFIEHTTALRANNRSDPVSDALRQMLQVTGGWSSHPPENSKEAKWLQCRDKNAKIITQFEAYVIDLDQEIHVGRWEPGLFAFIYLGNPEKGIIIPYPEKYLEYIPCKDFSTLTPAQVRASVGTELATNDQSLIPVDLEASLTTVEVKQALADQNGLLDDLKREMSDVKEAKTGELAELQRQMETIKAALEEKKAALMAELSEKKAEMERMKEQLENQIYLLDSQIYCILCYAGEVVRFGQIKKGKNAPDNTPIVVHQKLRFLDEDLGQLASLYEIQWENVGMFEEFLRHSPIALETFAPNERCIMLVRLSRTGKQLGSHDTIPYQNMMKDYEYYHGKTIGIIVRNGENVYLGWTDEDRVHIDDDLIVSQVITETEPAPETKFTFDSERERYQKQQKEERKKLLDGYISRAFVYNILQGLVDNTPLLPLPKGITLSKQSEYVLYSVADKWLSDNRYGSFTDIVEQCNSVMTAGDIILTVQNLIAERQRDVYGYTSKAWDNVRGRGERNRTRDCQVDDCTLYPVNLVEYDEPVLMTKYRYPFPDGTWHEAVHPAEDDRRLSQEAVIVEQYERRDRHVYVSVRKGSKSDWWSQYKGDDPRSNFEVFHNEYINLTYMNSVWLEWVITNKSLGDWKIAGNKVDYAYAIKYLKVAMEHVRKRETDEKELLDNIDRSICENTEWPLLLSQWKLSKGVRSLTVYQARRFAKQIISERAEA